jgi:hypothetical protein
MNHKARYDDLETRIKDQFPALFITLVSVLIGLALADLVSEARVRMVFWPVNLHTLRTWFELSGNLLSALSAWVIYAHIAISRRRIPTLADAIIAFTLPLCLLFGNSFVGIEPAWLWFYFATAFLVLSLIITIWMLHILDSESELATFRHLGRPTGYMSIFAAGIPFYALAGWADQHNLLSPLLEDACAASAAPAALIACHIFLRDWRHAINKARAIEPE